MSEHLVALFGIWCNDDTADVGAWCKTCDQRLGSWRHEVSLEELNTVINKHTSTGDYS